MKKTKVYRPRRGLRFSDDPGSSRPKAYFIGDDSLDRTRPTVAKVNLQLKQFSSVKPSGSVMTAVQTVPDVYAAPTNPTVLTSSLRIEGSVSMGRGYERKKLTATVLGLPANSIDRSPWPSEAVVDTVMTGNLTSPSWTRLNTLGFGQGFVINALSSSFRHELNVLNLFYSGTQAVENTPVPATASLFYTKENRLQTIIVKHTASFFDTQLSPLGLATPTTWAPGTGVLVTNITGGLFYGPTTNAVQSCILNPACFFISVPTAGKLVDIKVWIELTHITSSDSTARKPLGMLGIALRNPNLSWGHAHPLWNDPIYATEVGMTTIPDVTGWPAIPEFYRNSFLLWEGAGQAPGTVLAAGTVAAGQDADGNGGDAAGGFNLARYPSWERDRSMRTVFSDGGIAPNPRHLYNPTSPSGNFVGSPNSAFGIDCANGMNVPWTSDRTGLTSDDPTTYVADGSPPVGWLTGPGGVNNVNEWPTTGSNYGTNSIRPLYPLLDPIFIRKAGVTSSYSDQYPLPATPDQWKGFRPGLRGTEISGTWTLMIINSYNGLPGSPPGNSPNPDCYFRQVRLEITYETGMSARSGRLRMSSKHSARRAGQETYINAISGTDASNHGFAYGPNYDYFRTNIYTAAPDDSEIGRTIGITLSTGSFNYSQYALIYRLSGVLADISGSTPGWLLNNQFGMPAIPYSSATLSPPPTGSDVIVAPTVSPTKFITPVKVLDGARKLQDVVKDINLPLKLSTLAQRFVSTVLLSGSSNG